MVEFGRGYTHLMDREYSQFGHKRDYASADQLTAPNRGTVRIADVGMSMGLGPVPNVQAVGAKIRPGAKVVELGFMGMGKGSAQGHTPEMYGEKQRQALREMGTANRVDWTTHATVGVYGLAGMDQQGNFSKTQREMALHEVKRAIDFAADVATGGPVVVHTGEFHRPLVDQEWNVNDPKYKDKFRMYEQEAERASFRVVDTRTGQVIQEARKNREVTKPIWNVAKSGTEYKDFDGQMKTASDERDEKGLPIYMNYMGERLRPENRVPQYDPNEGKFMVKKLTWEDIKREAQDMTIRAKEIVADYRSGKMSERDFKNSFWIRFKDTPVDQIKVRPEEAYIISTLETNASNSRGWGYYYGAGFEGNIERIKKYEKALEFYKKLDAATDPEEKWKLQQQVPDHLHGLVPPDTKNPIDIIKRALDESKGHVKMNQESSASQFAQAAEAEEQIRHVQSADTYAHQEAFESYARLGINALKQSEKLKEMGKLKAPIALAMENLFPENYGSHPDELIELVKGSRAKMVQMLKQQGVSEKEAREKAETHLTSTFDTGHMNMWRKYWVGDEKKSMKENDEAFQKWMLDKVGQMAKEKIIGHVHLSDNYGYQDDHLAPGEGNTPIKELVKVLKDNGFKGKMIVEPGADYNTDVSGFHSVMKTWRYFGSPAYGESSGLAASGRTWNEVGYGFFGQNAPPYFVFGGYSPSEDWTLWSQVPLE